MIIAKTGINTFQKGKPIQNVDLIRIEFMATRIKTNKPMTFKAGILILERGKAIKAEDMVRIKTTSIGLSKKRPCPSRDIKTGVTDKAVQAKKEFKNDFILLCSQRVSYPETIPQLLQF